MGDKDASQVLISVVTIVYNDEKSIEKTMQSVLSQSYQSIEYIVVDGGSSDGTVNVIKKYEARNIKWISEKDNGIYDAMNKATQMATGEWICFINSGDTFIDETVVQKIADELNSTKSIDILYGNIIVEKHSKLIERKPKGAVNKHKMSFCHQSAFVRTDIQKKILFDLQYKMSADLKFFKECYKSGHKFHYLDAPIVTYDRSGISHTRRNAGLLENIDIVKHEDKGLERVMFLVRLYFTLYWRRLTKAEG